MKIEQGIVRIVDVTRLSGSLNINDRIFHRLVENMIFSQHQNIIRFIGYCSYAAEKEVDIDGKIIIAEKRERLLCFEYLRKGNLKKYLSGMMR
jgi:coatomer subunit beta'